MKQQQTLFSANTSPAALAKAISIAEKNVRQEMYGFNARRRPPKPFKAAEEFQRYQQFVTSKRAYKAMLPATGEFKVLRIVLTVAHKVSGCRVHHARDLRRISKALVREIDPACLGWCANLHIDSSNHLHLDVTVVVVPEMEAELRRRARTGHQISWAAPGRQRVASTTVRIQGTKPADLQRSLDYTLKFDRHRRKPKWSSEAIAVVGIAQASGFKRTRQSRFKPRSPTTPKHLKSNSNLSGNCSGQNQGTQKNSSIVSRQPIRDTARASVAIATPESAGERFRREPIRLSPAGANLPNGSCPASLHGLFSQWA